ncbi:MAG TPA: ABC transporter permease [Bryobacteraceae bacterium]|nr:ABC transporter permease [Bryobacteraceae bacterium]
MITAYVVLQSKWNPETSSVHVEFIIRNHTTEIWRPAEGLAIGYHVFDGDSGTLLIDGTRIQPERDVKPHETITIRMDVELPPEDGRYQVFISPMREDVCWYYEKGWPFLVLDASVAQGVVTAQRARVTTNKGLSRERLLRGIGRSVVYPLETIWQNRGLIRVMVRRDVLGRYRGSFGGSFWTVFNPLLLMLTYFYVFGYILKSTFPGDPSRSGFALYYLAGMLPWLAFSESVGRSPSVMLEHRNFVKKLVFAVETLPVNLVVAGLVSEIFAIILYCVFLVSVRHSIPLAVVWLPVMVVPQLLFTAGLSWFLAALGVFVRDLGQILGYLMTIWFFATPICYPEDSLPRELLPWAQKNPIYVLVKGYRDIFLHNQAPHFESLCGLWVLSAVVFVLGHAWFYKLRKSFADII